MSAILMVLPQIWAMAEAVSMPQGTPGGGFGADQTSVPARKGPHRLRLVRCSAHADAQRRPRLVKLPVAATAREVTAKAEERLQPAPEMAFYRKYTEGMLRRYQVMSMEAGRVPSLLGREMFRGKVTSYRVRGFDDVVIFCHDVGRCLEQLDPGQRLLLRKIAIEEHTQGETAAMAGLSLRTVVTRYAEALDALTRVFLERKLLEPLV